MKNTAMFMVSLTTAFLMVLTALAFTKIGFSWMFVLTVVGQVMVVIMVYKVLKDIYTTDKTFDDFYEDHPIGKEENYR